ncbi:MAG TPA: molybdenum cofactor guanylyltransferase [Pyrinomonadaceae bacterium]|nr:molybdenum cofactor guanylyltransferase [Pyrinomonadaceae bacterium]
MDSSEGFILIGGASSRMGTDKSQLKIEGESFVKHIGHVLKAVTAKVSVVGPAKPPDVELPLVPDIYPQWGALGGVHGALAACSAEWAVIVACDLPRVTTSLFNHMLALRDDVDAVAPLQPDGRRQPLCAIYRVSACLAQATALIERGERKPIALLQSVTTRWVEFAELADLPGAEDFFDNINTPQDYLRISQDTDQLG